MNEKSIRYLKREYYMDKHEFDIFKRLIALEKGEQLTVPTTPWINRMKVYRKGESIKAFVMVNKDLYSSTYMANPKLL